MGKRRRLNRACALEDIPHKARLRLVQKFVSIVPTLSGCVLWEGYKDRKGYGQVRVCGRAQWAHRVYYALFNGPIPEGTTVHHKCLDPKCVCPSHLVLASLSENTAEGNRRRSKSRTDVEELDINLPV